MAGEPGIELQTRLQTVARRIVETARLAASVHLFESLGQASQRYGRRIGIGGAGPVPPVDDAVDQATGTPAAGRTPSRVVVTDDEPAAMVTRDGAD